MKMTWEFKSEHHCTEKKTCITAFGKYVAILVIYIYMYIYIYTRLYYGNSLVYTFWKYLAIIWKPLLQRQLSDRLLQALIASTSCNWGARHHGLKAAVRRNNNETTTTTVVCIEWDGFLIKQMFHTPACCICLVALPPLILMIWAAASQQINVSCVLAGCKKETDQPTKTLSLKLLVTFGKCWSSPFCFLFCFQKPWKKNNHQKPLSKHHVVWTAPF